MSKFSIFNFQLSTERGFTLIELIVAIGVLSILAIFAIAALNPLDQFEKARDSQRKSDLAQLQRVLEQYYQDHGSYPASNNVHQMTDFNGNAIIWGGSSGWSPYLTLVPNDPTNVFKTYVYNSTNNGQQYQLYASLERGPADPATCNASVQNCKQNPTSVQFCTCSGVPAGVDCGAYGKHYPCNYGVSSPNTAP